MSLDESWNYIPALAEEDLAQAVYRQGQQIYALEEKLSQAWQRIASLEINLVTVCQLFKQFCQLLPPPPESEAVLALSQALEALAGEVTAGGGGGGRDGLAFAARFGATSPMLDEEEEPPQAA